MHYANISLQMLICENISQIIISTFFYLKNKGIYTDINDIFNSRKLHFDKKLLIILLIF